MNFKDNKRTLDPHDSDGEEETIIKGGARQASEKQQEIDELGKRLRLVELEFKKKEIEINAELANERQRADELQEILTKKLGDMKENREANELQERLILVEDELFEKQQIAHEMLRQLTQMEQENDQLKSEVDRYRAQDSTHGSPARSSSIDSNLDVEKILSRCMQLEKENRDLSTEVEQIRRGAIDAIVEKEKLILDLQEALDQMQASISQDNSAVSAAAESQLKEVVEQLQSEYTAELQAMSNRCEDLQTRLEQEQRFHEEQMHSLDSSINQRVFENLQHHIDSAKSNEADLLQQLKLLEERVKSQDRLFADSQKLLAQTREELKREKEANELKVARLTRQTETSEELQRTLKSLSKDFEDAKRTAEKDAADKQVQLEKLAAKRDELVKNNVNLETDNRLLRENLASTKSTLSQLESTIETLYAQLDEVQRDAQLALKATADQHEIEKSALYDSLMKAGAHAPTPSGLPSARNHPNPQQDKNTRRSNVPMTSINHNSQNIAATTTTLVKEFTTEGLHNNEAVSSIMHDGTNQNQLNNYAATAAAAASPYKSTNNVDVTATPTSKSTLLGLEFGDEDFNFEEEKTDSSSAVQQSSSMNSPPPSSQSQQQQQESHQQYQQKSGGDSDNSSSKKKKKTSFNIVESTINPLQIISGDSIGPGSTRNKFKQQFMFSPAIVAGQQLQQNPQSQQQQQDGSQPQPSENVFELRAKISKLECYVASYEVTIEKLQNESKRILKQLQEARREKVLSNKEADLIDELNSFKMHCQRVETQFVTQKLQLTEDLHFYKEEVRIFEKQNIEYRDSLAVAVSELEFYKGKYTKLKGILKQRRAGGSLGGNGYMIDAPQYYPSQIEQANLFPKSPTGNQTFNIHPSNMQQQQQQQQQQSAQQQQNKKKTFWIFK